MDRIGVSAGGRQNMTDQRRFVRLLAFRVFDLPGERCGQPIKFFRGQPIDKIQIGRQRTKILPGIERQITRQEIHDPALAHGGGGFSLSGLFEPGGDPGAPIAQMVIKRAWHRVHRRSALGVLLRRSSPREAWSGQARVLWPR